MTGAMNHSSSESEGIGLSDEREAEEWATAHGNGGLGDTLVELPMQDLKILGVK